MYRSSTGNLGYYDDPPPRRSGGGERWDREKFERFRRGPEERESFHFDERDRSGPRGSSRDIEFDERFERRGPSGRSSTVRLEERERDRYFDDERYERPMRPRPTFIDEPTAAEVANRALAPYRRKSITERDIDVAISSRRPARPQFIRRQSSLDTFDRKPMPRYGDREREEWRPPTNVPIPLPIRERERPRSPPRSRYREDDFEEIRYRDAEPSFREEDYREVHIEREKSRVRKRSPSRVSRTSRRSESRRAPSAKSSTSSFEEVSPPRQQLGKKGKTRMPKRLVQKQAVIDLGYPFEEEDDFLIVRRALEKEQIDEIIKISEGYKEKKVTYRYDEEEEVVDVHAPPPPPESVHSFHPPPPSVHSAHPPPPPTSVHSVRTSFPPPPPSMHGGHHAGTPPPPPPPPPEFMHAPPPPPSVYQPAYSVRSPSPRTVFEERIQESNHVGGPLTVLAPQHRGEREITAEIERLETERRIMKLERDNESTYEIVERREPKREVVRVEKDRKVIRRRKSTDAKIVAAMMSTLS